MRVALAALATVALASWQAQASPSEQAQEAALLACQDHLYGAPSRPSETWVDTVYHGGQPMLRVVPGGSVRSLNAANAINACADKSWARGGVLPRSSGQFADDLHKPVSSPGCYPGAPRLYKGTMYCFD